MKIHVLVMTILLFASACVYAQDQGPMNTPRINSTYYVGSLSGLQFYPTIQSAVTDACASGDRSVVDIPASYTGSDPISGVTGGCTNAVIEDEHNGLPTMCYNWISTVYTITPCMFSSGSGTVGSGTTNQAAIYTGPGTTVTGGTLTTAGGGTGATDAADALSGLAQLAGGLQPIPGITYSNTVNDAPINAALAAGGSFVLPTNVQLANSSLIQQIQYNNTLNYTVPGTKLVGNSGVYGGSNSAIKTTLAYIGSSSSTPITSVQTYGTYATVAIGTLPAVGSFGYFTGVTGANAVGMNSYANNFQVTSVNSTNGTFNVWYNGAAGGPYSQSGANWVTTGDGLDLGCSLTLSSGVCDPIYLADFNIQGPSNATGVGLNFGAPGNGSTYNTDWATVHNVQVGGYPQAVYLQGVNQANMRLSVRGTTHSTNLFLIDQWKNGTGSEYWVSGCSGASASDLSVAAGCFRAQNLDIGTKVHFTGTNNASTLLWVGNYSQDPWSATATVTQSGGVVSVTLLTGGYGYPKCPTLQITGGGGAGANFTPVCSGPPGNMTVTGITTVSGGSGYSSTGLTYAFFLGNTGHVDADFADIENTTGYVGFAETASTLNVGMFHGALTAYLSVGPMFYASAQSTITLHAIPAASGTFTPPTLAASGAGSYTGTYYFWYEGVTPYGICNDTNQNWNTGPSSSGTISGLSSQGVSIIPQYMGATCSGVINSAHYNIYENTTNNSATAKLIAQNVAASSTSPYVSSGAENLSVAISSFTVSGSGPYTVTFTTAANTLACNPWCPTALFSGFASGGSGLNGTTAAVLSSNLTSTTFQISTSISGLASDSGVFYLTPSVDNRPYYYVAVTNATVTCDAAVGYNISTTGNLQAVGYATGELSNGRYVPACNPGVVYVVGHGTTGLPTASAKTVDKTYCTVATPSYNVADYCAVGTATPVGDGVNFTYGWADASPTPTLGSGSYVKATALQGTDPKVLTAGTNSGVTGAALCNDANGGATTSSCTGGGGSIPPAGIPQSTGSAWGTSFTAPTGNLVGTGSVNTFTASNHFQGFTYFENASGAGTQTQTIATSYATNSAAPPLSFRYSLWDGSAAQLASIGLVPLTTNINSSPVLTLSGTCTANTGALTGTCAGDFHSWTAGFILPATASVSGSGAFNTGAFATIANYAPLVSPSFTTPALGTPASGVITNLTGTCTSCSIGGNAATATSATSATTATNIAGGAAGSIPTQTAAGATGFVAGNATGSTDAVLTSTSVSGAYSSTSLKNAPALSAANMSSITPTSAINLASGGAGGVTGVLPTANIAVAQTTRTVTVSDIAPATGDDLLIVVLDPATAAQLTRFSCGVTGTTSVITNLVSGGNSLIADMTATAGTVNQVVVTTWVSGSCSSQTTYCPVAAHTPVTLHIGTISGTPTSLSCALDYTVN